MKRPAFPSPLRRAAALCLGTMIAFAGGGAGAASAAGVATDYPTETLADYVFACMASNGETREMLQRCSCSIDVIASLLPYEKYVQAETILGLLQVSGERTAVVRDPVWTQEVVAELRRAQAEAEIRCF